MEKEEKKSKKEIWREISLDFRALCRELRLWWFPKKLGADQTDKNEREQKRKDAEVQKKKVGMFYYAVDKSFSEELIPYKTVSGVVGYVDKTGEHGLVVLLHQEELQWLSQFLCVGIPDDGKGKENTRLILEFAQKRGLKAKAAEYCANYAYDGVKAGEAFLPSIEELKYLCENKELINYKLFLICGAVLFDEWYYWSSSEYSDYKAWVLYFGYGNANDDYKNNSYCSVRPVVAF